MPDIDPDQHRLVVHGLVERPLSFTMDDLLRFPSVSRIHFVECSGSMIGSGRDALRTGWYMSALPGAAIMPTVVALDVLGDGLHAVLSPRSNAMFFEFQNNKIVKM